MVLTANTLVFLDTGFFKAHKPTDNVFRDFLKYSKDEKIVLCTSSICLREWRSQLINAMHGYVRNIQGAYSSKRRSNILADELLETYQLNYPEESEIERLSIPVIENFIKNNKIKIYSATEEHIERTFEAYFRGAPPYECPKEKKDIPDSWIFEAAKDARFDETHKELENKFSIGTDKRLNVHLEDLGLKAVNKQELLEMLKREEDEIASNSEFEPTEPEATKQNKLEKQKEPICEGLESVLATAINDNVKEIYTRVLGYTHWLNSPKKETLYSRIEERGFNRHLIEGCAAILAQDSLNLIKDTGNHFITRNESICNEASDLIMEEILEFLL